MSRWAMLSPFRIALLATLAVMLAYLAVSQSAPLRRLEGQLLDLRFQLRPEPTAAAVPIVLVMIDDASIAALGRWPWSRARLAELLDAVTGAGARTVGFDLLLAEPELTEQSGPWLRDLDDALRMRQAPEGWRRLDEVLARRAAAAGGDQALVQAMRRAGVVVPFSFEFGGPSPSSAATAPEPPPEVARAAYRAYRQAAGAGEPSVPLVATSLLPPIPAVAEAAVGLGHVNIARDRDGTARFEYPVVAYRGAYYPSFAIEVVRTYLRLDPADVLVEFGQGIQLGERFVPTDEGMRLLVAYRRPGRYRTFSFADVLAGEVPADAFRDAIVLVGGAAAGLGESFVTPFSPALPGTARHATVVDSLLAGDLLVRRDATALADLTVMAAAGLLLGAAAARFGMAGTTLALAALLLAVSAGNVLAFTRLGLWLNLLFPLLALLAVYAAAMLYKYVAGQRQQRQIRRAFEHYVHPAVVAEVSRNPQLLKLGGEERELSVMFADIRGFTPMAERLPPPDLVRVMNGWYTAMTRVIVDGRGMLDQYVGDGLVAVFGAPLPLEDHPFRACEAALAMHRALADLNTELARENLPSLRIGIGINTGPMILGNLGSEERFGYTILGDGVNLAARLESATKDYGVGVLVSEATWRGADGRIAGRELDVIRVKGKETPVRVFEVLGVPPLPEPQRRLVDDFTAALAAYREGRWHEALAAFERVLERAPGDGPSLLYLRRCRERTSGERRAG